MSLPIPAGSDQPHHDERGDGEHPGCKPRPCRREAPGPLRAPVPAPRVRAGAFDPEPARPAGSAARAADDGGCEGEDLADLVAAGVVDMVAGDPPAPVS